MEQRDRLRSNETRAVFKDLPEVSLDDRLWHARFEPASGAYGPTPSQRSSVDIARSLYTEVVQELRNLVDSEYEMLKAALDRAGVPWTPGRGVQ